MRPSEMLKILSVPGTDERLSLVTSAYAGSEPYNGWLEDAQGKVWARLDAFRFRFVKFNEVTDDERQRIASEGPAEVLVPEGAYVSSLSDRFKWLEATLQTDGYLKGFNGDESEAAAFFSTTARRVELIFNAHGWSGIARIEVDGIPVGDIDLFNQENNVARRFFVENESLEPCTIMITPIGRNPSSQGTQILIDGAVEYTTNMVVPEFSKIDARNRGGNFRSRFFEICDTLGEDAIILDVGGGRRQLADPRYLNLEYSNFDEPDIFGDATALPFMTGTIDFIYTAAVLEHVRDPLGMGKELHRVLKPGSKILANAAFMQPVHSEGQHFFNVTPYGIDLTFEMFNERKVWWETGFFSTIEWFADVTHLKRHADSTKVDQFLALAEEFSAMIPEDRGMYVASGVWLEGVK